MSFSIATYNIHHGRNAGELYFPSRLFDVIENLDVDILCLQEVDFFSLRTYFVNQSKRIAKRFGYNFVFSNVRFYGLGFQGNTILSRFPIIGSSEMSLSREDGSQLRKALKVVLEVDEKELCVVCTHLHSQGHSRTFNVQAGVQLNELLSDVGSCDRSLVMGDFNMLPNQVEPIAKECGYSSYSEFLTSPGGNPRQQIDWILSKHIQVSDVVVGGTFVGDHRPLKAQCSLEFV